MQESNFIFTYLKLFLDFCNSYYISVGFIKVTDAKKKSDEDQAQLEDAMATKKRQDKEMEALQERIDELQSENAKLIKSKKRLQEEVCFILKTISIQHLWMLCPCLFQGMYSLHVTLVYD